MFGSSVSATLGLPAWLSVSDATSATYQDESRCDQDRPERAVRLYIPLTETCRAKSVLAYKWQMLNRSALLHEQQSANATCSLSPSCRASIRSPKDDHLQVCVMRRLRKQDVLFIRKAGTLLFHLSPKQWLIYSCIGVETMRHAQHTLDPTEPLTLHISMFPVRLCECCSISGIRRQYWVGCLLVVGFHIPACGEEKAFALDCYAPQIRILESEYGSRGLGNCVLAVPRETVSRANRRAACPCATTWIVVGAYLPCIWCFAPNA